ncbi:transmembrane protein with EGF-like and two follistatin-like domains 1 [Phytophthora pseudosyringae]|uniref:Transmembrane protein with EGF-like and two follistatin-like domains 1 n=1 Tax=Phytophthora pseudosyringae TaxID=221518 RepID=A0A8T1W4V9_9STRA|nr:transmembrane protein with EGF-like and two follistatin-like domains 1 [Phytophthora pseudosyringae]
MKFTLGLALVAVAVTSAAAADDKCSFGCLDVYKPVCGSNGETYSNSCYLRLASCNSNNEITEAGNGGCASTPASSTTPSPVTSTAGSKSGTVGCPDACLDVYDPVSDENGVEYSNECYMKMAKCQGTSDKGNDNPGFSTLDAQRKLAFAPGYKGGMCGDMLCPDNYAPVCGSDGVTYSNECNLGITSCNHPEQNITRVGDGSCPTQQHEQQHQQQHQQS